MVEQLDVATEDLDRLVEQASGGDAAAWESLYRRSYPRLLACAGRRLDADDAREAVAETFERALGAIRSFTSIGR